MEPLPARRSAPAGLLRRYNAGPDPQDLGEMNVICPRCKALHFGAEKMKGSSVAAPRFQTCCKDGKVVLPSIQEQPEVLKELWTSESARARSFRSFARKYNSAFAFTSFNYKSGQRPEEAGVRGGFRSFMIHAEVYHMIGTVPRNGHR